MGELLSQVISSQRLSRETLLRIAEESPHFSFALAAPTAVVLQRLADDAADGSVRTPWLLLELGNRLSDLGRHEEALTAVEEAAGIHRQLAETRPDVFLPSGLARTLDNFADMLTLFNRERYQ